MITPRCLTQKSDEEVAISNDPVLVFNTQHRLCIVPQQINTQRSLLCYTQTGSNPSLPQLLQLKQTDSWRGGGMACHCELFVPHSVTLAGWSLTYLPLPLYLPLSRQLFIHILVWGWWLVDIINTICQQVVFSVCASHYKGNTAGFSVTAPSWLMVVSTRSLIGSVSHMFPVQHVFTAVYSSKCTGNALSKPHHLLFSVNHHHQLLRPFLFLEVVSSSSSPAKLKVLVFLTATLIGALWQHLLV